jgi:hypothetical protein
MLVWRKKTSPRPELKNFCFVVRLGLARVLGRRIVIVPVPVWFHCVLAQIFEWSMKVPLIAKAQVRMLAEGIVEAAQPCDRLPADLMPTRRFTDQQIRQGLPQPGAFGIRHLRCSAS